MTKKSTLIFVLGGASSGKSQFALKTAGSKKPRAFLATAEPLDGEMSMRIQAHQKTRRGGWETVEIPVHLAKWFQIEGRQYHTVVLDCLTLWLNNLQRTGIKTRNIPALVSKLLKSTQSVSGRVVMVSNELGLGLVPGDSLSRQFRSLAGDMNQKVAAAADEAYFIVSGIPIRLK